MKCISLCLLMACGSLFAGETVTRMIVFDLKLEPGSAEEKAFKDATLALAAHESVKEMAWMDVDGKKSGYNRGVRIVFFNSNAVEPYVKSKEHREYIRDVWKPVVGELQMIDYTEPEISSKK